MKSGFCWSNLVSLRVTNELSNLCLRIKTRSGNSENRTGDWVCSSTVCCQLCYTRCHTIYRFLSLSSHPYSFTFGLWCWVYNRRFVRSATWQKYMVLFDGFFVCCLNLRAFSIVSFVCIRGFWWDFHKFRTMFQPLVSLWASCSEFHSDRQPYSDVCVSVCMCVLWNICREYLYP